MSSRIGGIGLRSTEKHSPAAFLSSQTSCYNLCTKLDPNYLWDLSNIHADSHKALTDFNSIVGYNNQLQPDSEMETFPRQQMLSKAIDENSLAIIKATRANDTYFQAHLNLITNSGAGYWLQATPSKALGTWVDPQLFRIMTQRWLRVPIYEAEFHCPFCDGVVDRFGDHCLTCACGGDRTKRHNLIRNEVFFFCNSMGLNPELERPGILQPRPLIGVLQESGVARDPSGNRRPADVYLPRWRRGTPAALDFAVTSGLRSDIVNRSAEDGSQALKMYEDFKCSYLDTKTICQAEGVNFIPIICEADGGGWGPAANRVWSVLAQQKSVLTGESSSIIISRLLQSLGLVLHRENARAILRRFPTMAERDCSELLAASVTCSTTADE